MVINPSSLQDSSEEILSKPMPQEDFSEATNSNSLNREEDCSEDNSNSKVLVRNNQIPLMETNQEDFSVEGKPKPEPVFSEATPPNNPNKTLACSANPPNPSSKQAFLASNNLNKAEDCSVNLSNPSRVEECLAETLKPQEVFSANPSNKPLRSVVNNRRLAEFSEELTQQPKEEASSVGSSNRLREEDFSETNRKQEYSVKLSNQEAVSSVNLPNNRLAVVCLDNPLNSHKQVAVCLANPPKPQHQPGERSNSLQLHHGEPNNSLAHHFSVTKPNNPQINLAVLHGV